jgi:superfamily II DNA or RNA helicase
VFSQPINVQANVNLRPVQRDNLMLLQQHFLERNPLRRRILVDMCTGSGKTGFACMAPFALEQAGPQGCRRVLWVTPSIVGRQGGLQHMLVYQISLPHMFTMQ